MPCTTILVGKKATYDGSTIISRTDDGGFEAKKIVVVSPKDQPRKYKCVISHLEIELPDNPLRYTSVPSVSPKNGLWPACGVNSKNVAMTATETITSNPRVIGADPYVRFSPKDPKKRGSKDIVGGIGEEDLVTLVLPYINSAKEGVVRLGELLEKYGTYEANGIAFSDENDIWWVETIGGHHFIAARVPENKVVIMPNQFGLDNFDFSDAFGKQENYMCSSDLREFIKDNHLDLNNDGRFNPRYCFGSRRDQDHIYNTPRAWYLSRYFMPTEYKWDGDNADFTPESDNIAWSFIPEKKVTLEDIKYVLGSHYQGTKYDPYSHGEAPGKYRSIGVPNSDDTGILQIRGYMPEDIKAVEWMSLGGGAFTCCFPFYPNVSKLPDYLSKTTLTVSTNSMYWHSRLIAALVDAHFANNVIFAERYQLQVFSEAQTILNRYDHEMIQSGKFDKLEEANEKLIKMVQGESDKTLSQVLRTSSEKMKTRFNRNDN